MCCFFVKNAGLFGRVLPATSAVHTVVHGIKYVSSSVCLLCVVCVKIKGTSGEEVLQNLNYLKKYLCY